MRKNLRVLLVLLITVSVLFSACAKRSNSIENQETRKQAESTIQTEKKDGPEKGNSASEQKNENENNVTGQNSNESNNVKTEESNTDAGPQIDYEKVKPNEAGKVMVVMFHNFVEEYKSGDKFYTTTFDSFRTLLQELYDKGYRLVNLNDYINNNISVPAGFIPMVFTFDDGTAGQFNLVKDGERLVANKNSAVGIMEEFAKTHPDFGLKGTFYVNLGLGTFQGEGTVTERLKYLIDKGFELGNHTLTHVKLSKVQSAEKIQEEIGGNQIKLDELIPGYKFTTFSLPYGLPSKELQGYVAKGEYQGIKYENMAIMEVGWDPNVSPVSVKFNPLSIHRVRASGIVPVDADLAWWLKQLSKQEQYISDGDPNTVTVPKAKESGVDKNKLNGKKLNVY